MSFSDSSVESIASEDYPRKRRKRSKEDRMLGVFGSDSEDDRSDRLGRKTLHDKAVAFDKAGYLSSDDEVDSRPMLGGHKSPVAQSSTKSLKSQDDAIIPEARFGFFQDATKPFIPSANPPVSNRETHQYKNSSTQTRRPDVKNKPDKPIAEDPASQKLKSGKAAQMMARMGYKSGDALGTSGKGIVRPLEAKLRPGQKAGLGSISEKTDQEIDEEIRHRPRNGPSQLVSEPEKRARSRKPKVKYQTTKEIEDAAGGGLAIPKILGTIIDMRGPEAKSILDTEHLISTRSVTPTNEAYRLSQAARQEVMRYTADWQTLQERKTYLRAESARCYDQQRQEIDEVHKLQGLLERIQRSKQQIADIDDEETIINRLTESLGSLQADYRDQIEHYKLDHAAVAMLAPWFRRTIAFTDIISPPPEYVAHFMSLQKILRVPMLHAESLVSVRDRSSLPFESLMSVIWLPRFRAAIGTDWAPEDSVRIITALATWSSLIPPFIKRQLLDQSILPRLLSLIQNWHPKRARNSRDISWLFQWLPVLDDRTTELLESVRRRFALVLNRWNIDDGILQDLPLWREVFGSDNLDEVLTINLLPKLAESLRKIDLLHITPSTHHTISSILAWKSQFKPIVFEHLFAAEFFPRWLQSLWHQLTKSPDLAVIGEWYEQWSGMFSESLRSLASFKRGFSKGLEMMEHTLEFGPETLPNPQQGPVRPFDHLQHVTARKESRNKSIRAIESEDPHEISFKDVLEHWCADHDLLMMPLRKAHESGNSLYKLTNSQGKLAATIYLKGDIVMRQNSSNMSFVPVSLDDLAAVA